MGKLFFFAVSIILISGAVASAADLCVALKETGDLGTHWYEIRCTGEKNTSVPIAIHGQFFWDSKKTEALALDNLKKLMDGKGYVNVGTWSQAPYILYQKNAEVKPGSSYCLVERSTMNAESAWAAHPIGYKIDCNNGLVNTVTGLDKNQDLDGINAYMVKNGLQLLANFDPMYNNGDRAARFLVFGQP